MVNSCPYSYLRASLFSVSSTSSIETRLSTALTNMLFSNFCTDCDYLMSLRFIPNSKSFSKCGLCLIYYFTEISCPVKSSKKIRPKLHMSDRLVSSYSAILYIEFCF